jgi:cytochrome c peroxidase|tara:strand:- start:3657 stop:4733 length:1077 start_codon:yes stop_codon:yes gene_type:complete
MIYRITYLLVLIFALASCKKGTIEPINAPYALEEPSHFPKMVIPEDNPLTVAGVDLGRRLFYEKRLSGDNSLSCGGCHSPQESFSDKNQFSRGIDGTLGRRNSMALVNLGYQKFLFWDGRSKSLEEQILQPVQDPIEMHQSWTDAVIKIKADANYRKAFYVAFGTDQVDSTLVSKAIAQFLRTMISGFSKYDVMYKQANNLSLTAKEQTLSSQITNEDWAGYDLFKSLNGGDCFHCHNGPLMHLELFSNNGLDNTFLDLGRGEVTKSPSDYGKFKVPTLRNIALTGPYMHDGRFETLEEVIEHYSSGIKLSPTISPLIEFANQGGVQLDAFEKGLIKKFLLTLTDEEFINNPKFAPPK